MRTADQRKAITHLIARISACALVCLTGHVAAQAPPTPPASAPTPSQAASAAAATVNTLPAIRNQFSTQSLQQHLGTYNRGTSETLFQNGRGDTVAPGGARVTGCANQDDVECQAVQAMQRGRINPSTIIPPNSPLLQGRDNLVNNPAGVLGFDPALSAGVTSNVQCRSFSTTQAEIRELTTCDITTPAADLDCSIGRQVIVDPDSIYSCITRTATNEASTCSVGRVIAVNATTTYQCVEQERAMSASTCTVGAVVVVRADTTYQCRTQLRAVGNSNCAIGNVVTVDPRYNYSCGATPYTVTTNNCARTLSVTCDAPTDGCSAAGLVPSSTQGDMRATYTDIGGGSFGLVWGSYADNIWDSCGTIISRTLDFSLQNVADMSELRLARIAWDDHVLVRLNGNIVYGGPNPGTNSLYAVGVTSTNPFTGLESTAPSYLCHATNVPGTIKSYSEPDNPAIACTATDDFERRTSWNVTPDVNLLPYAVTGVNRLEMFVQACGGGEGAMTINVRQFCPRVCRDTWNNTACQPYIIRQ